MAEAKDLPIYRATYEFVSKLVSWVENFPRIHRYTLGNKVIDNAAELFTYIQLANMYADKRAQYLMSFTVKLELTKTLLRLCFERKLLSPKQSADICRMTTNIGKQATGWRKARKF